jgi:hypothetical protein
MEKFKKSKYSGIILNLKTVSSGKLRYIRLANGILIDGKNKKAYNDFLKLEQYLTKRVLDSPKTMNKIKNPKTRDYINKKIKEK